MKKSLKIFEVKEILKNLKINVSKVNCAMPCENTLCNLEAEIEGWESELEKLEMIESNKARG